MSIFDQLKKIFSSDVVVHSVGNRKYRIFDVNRIQQAGKLKTNALFDRFEKIYTTTGAGIYNMTNIYNYQTLKVQLYTDYEAMDTDPIISTALNIICDECTVRNQNGYMLNISTDDDNLKETLENLFYDILNIDFNLWGWIRNMLKYGDYYLKLEIAEDLGIYNVVPFSAYSIIREEGVDPNNPSYVRFKYDPTSVAGINSGYAYTRGLNVGAREIYFENYEMIHFRLLGDAAFLPYGKSFLENARKIFKQLVLMEDAMLVHRIVRAPEKRVFYYQVGSTAPHEAEAILQKNANRVKRTPYIDENTGEYNLKFNLMNMMEDFWIAVRDKNDATRVENLAGIKYDGIDDVNYLLNKLFSALIVPKSFLGYEKDVEGKAILATEGLRFAGTIDRIQRTIIGELYKMALIHLKVRGFDDSAMANFTLNLNSPSVIYDKERMDLLQTKVNLADSILSKDIFPSDWIYKNIFYLSEDEFEEMREKIIEDKKREFRIKQITTEGNDPNETNQVFGTPHQLASIYGTGTTFANSLKELVEKSQRDKKSVGRPESRNWKDKQENPLGKDRFGEKEAKDMTVDMMNNYAIESNMRESVNYEDTKRGYYLKKNKGLLDFMDNSLKFSIKKNNKNENDLLSERSIL